MQAAPQIKSERLFLNSINSKYTQTSYKFYLKRYLDICGYKDMDELLSRDHKQIENEIIEVIITFKEKGMKRQAISNYIKPVIAYCKIMDVYLNVSKINKFMPPRTKNNKGSGYSAEMIQKLLDISDERMRCVILLASQCGCRIGSIPGLSVGSLEEVKDLYRITVYEGEPEQYTVFTTNEGRRAIDAYISMRRDVYHEVITKSSPLIREQFDKRDPFAIANPRRIKEDVLMKKLTEMAEAAGLRTRTHLKEGQKPGSQTKDIPVCNGFRRYYSKTLLDSGLITEMRWKLEGHSLHGNDASNIKINPDDLLEQFEKAHDNLVIEPSMRMRRKIEKLESEKTEIQELRSELEKVKKAIHV
jgi:integrase